VQAHEPTELPVVLRDDVQPARVAQLHLADHPGDTVGVDDAGADVQRGLRGVAGREVVGLLPGGGRRERLGVVEVLE
jgi:hypothetical protein